MSTTIPNIPDNCYYDGTSIPTTTLQSMSPEPEPEPQITLQEKTVTNSENGQSIVTPDTGYDGLSQVTINTSVPTHTALLQSKSETITSNTTTTITPDSGYDGLSSVSITTQVPTTTYKKNVISSIRIQYKGSQGDRDFWADISNLQLNQSQTSFQTHCLYIIVDTPNNYYDIHFVAANKTIPANVYYISFDTVSVDYYKDIVLINMYGPSCDFIKSVYSDADEIFRIKLSMTDYQFNLPTQS